MASRRVSDILWLWWKYTGTWPPTRGHVDRHIAEGGDIALLENHIKLHGAPRGSTVMPQWAIDMVRAEVGVNAAFLTQPELAPLLIQAAAENWEASKLQAAIENTGYWKNTTSRQRQWAMLSDAERAQLRAQWVVTVVETLQGLYGPEEAARKGYSLTDARVIKWAEELASGVQTTEVFNFAHRAAAEGITGTPAYAARLEEFRRAGAPQVEQENLAGELEDEWRRWVGDELPPPNLAVWAENIYMNKRSRQDFETFAKQTAQSRWPTKDVNLSFSDWVQPAKTLLGTVLELGHVSDSEPLLQSYTNGEIPSLAELWTRARRDPRFQGTRRSVEGASRLGLSIAERWGFLSG